LLRPGLADYSLELGSLRQDYGKRSFDYDDLLTTASYRRGLTDTVTTGSRVEAQSDGTFALGADVAWLAGPVGIVTAYGATGGRGDQTGMLGGVGVEHDGARLSLFVHTQYASRNFRQLGAELLERTPRQRTFAGLGVDLQRFGSVQLAGGVQTYYDDAPVQTLGLTYGLALGSYGYVSLFATRAVATDSETTVLLSWTLPLGQRGSANTAVQRSATAAGDSLEAYASFQHDLPTDTGFGYRVSLSTSDERDAGVAYRGHAGVATLEYAQRGGASGLRLDANGGLALTSTGILPARRLDQSFAVVQVADYPGLTVYLDNQPVGRTDAHGRVLVETLRPYERNQVALDPKQVPMDGALAQASIDVIPAYRSGAVVRFPVTRALAATMHLVQRDGAAVPAGATATVHARPFPVALDGLLYVEGLAAETAIDVRWVGGQCRVIARRPTGDDAIPDLGTLRCE
jgi:outer membrane usher protein